MVITMKKQFDSFRKIVEQAWLPIFVADAYDTETLLAGCEKAGLSAIEYTLRRKDAAEVLPHLKKRFPHAAVLMGSIIDSDEIVRERKERFPQLLTISDIAPYVDGFVSMLPFSDETLKVYKDTHLCIPEAESSGEALRQVKGGAAFIKILGPDLALARRLHALPTFDYCPTYITGGVTEERMDEVFSAGNVICASGFDVVLKGISPEELTADMVAERLCCFVSAAKKARAKVFPTLANAESLSDEAFLKAFPNYCAVR